MSELSFSVYGATPLASSVSQFFSAQALHLKEGRIEAIARGYAVPLVVSLPDSEAGYAVISSRRGIEHFFSLKHAGLEQAGIAYLRVRVLQVVASGAHRVNALAEWYYLAADSTRAGQTTARYFLERRRGSLAVQMIEFERVAFPALADWFREAGDTRARRQLWLN